MNKLFYGVMVTRQILVLKFQVRVLVEQQNKPSLNITLKRVFFFYFRMVPVIYI